MKYRNKGLIILIMVLTTLISGCSFNKDDLEGARIYTTVYPINYLTNYLYSNHGTISSIYPSDCDIDTYKLTKKQIKEYAKADLFIYNGLTDEKETAKTLINENGNLLIIDVSYGLTLHDDLTELWLSPNNYLKLAKNIKYNLQEYITSKSIIDNIDENYSVLEQEISIIDANLHTLGKNAKDNGKNVIVASSDKFKYLENYGFEIVSLTDEENLKEHKLNTIKNNFKSKVYTYILVADTDKDSELIKELSSKYKAKTIEVDTMTLTLDNNYFDIMTSYIENIKTIVS